MSGAFPVTGGREKVEEQFFNRRTVQRKQVNLPCEIRAAGEVYSGEILDISLTGAQVLCKELEVKAGSLVELKVLIDDVPVEVVGKVTRKAGQRPGIGIRFRGEARQLSATLAPILRLKQG